MSSKSPLPAWLWLGVPIGVVLAQIAAKTASEQFYLTWMHGEFGLVENLTVLFLVLGVFSALKLWTLRTRVESRLFGPFALVMAAGCFFFAGEEASWGQHWLGFEVPDVVAARNEQGEFNLHNDPLLETVFDQLPRNLLTLAALIGGVCAPLLLRRRRRIWPAFGSPGVTGWIWPTAVCLPSALLALLANLPKKLTGDHIPRAIDFSGGETKEMALALFLMLYLTTLRRELQERSRA